MDQPIRSALSFFSRKYERILLIILFVQIPMLAVYFYIANYMYIAVPALNSDFGMADIINGFFMIVLFLFAQIPFIYFWHYEEQGQEKALRSAFLQSAIRAFHFFVFSVSLAFAVVIGFALFVIPGLIIMALFISAPVISIMDEKSVWKSIKESVQIFKKHHWKLVLLIVSFGMIEFIFSIVIQQLVINITTSYLAIVLIHLFINTVFFPLFFLTLAFLVGKWRTELGLYSINHEAVSI